MNMAEKGKHKALKYIAEKILRGKGFTDDEIKEEYCISISSDIVSKSNSISRNLFIVDFAGIKNDYKVAIEVGTCKQSKLILLSQVGFDEVIHLPYGFEELVSPGSMDLESELYDVIKERETEIKKLKKELVNATRNFFHYERRIRDSELSYLVVGTLAEMFLRARKYRNEYTNKFNEPYTTHEKKLRHNMGVLADVLELIYDTEHRAQPRGSENTWRRKQLDRLTDSLESFIKEVRQEKFDRET